VEIGISAKCDSLQPRQPLEQSAEIGEVDAEGAAVQIQSNDAAIVLRENHSPAALPRVAVDP
jgi:hypothetical protein